MKRGPWVPLTVAGVVAVVVVSLVWTYRANRSTGAVLKSSAPAADRVLAVDDLKEKPERFAGEMRVFGVVGGTKASEHLFGLIDKREVEVNLVMLSSK